MIKRLFDFLFSISVLIVLIPVILVVALLVLIKMGWPIVFTQLRPGKGGKPFTIYKFRSMIYRWDKRGVLLPDAKRLTQFGQFLRSTSCDELPALWNVLKGEMSIVGPRPLLMEYLPLYNEKQSRRHDVKPGITGWAQVNGRNAISWQEKFDLDVWYVENQSFFLDLKILLMTAKKIIIRDGISGDGEATMSKFTGNNK
ncbi:WcaJ Sugar transferases involved in lipopolysaccharide synthesis [Candidatus Methylopumilus planktonicus]|uniref:sugar transferase n=1 Tax=Candidatus Methylopumilus planktonicus TaxID=1581557 RepID=UPI003BEF230C